MGSDHREDEDVGRGGCQTSLSNVGVGKVQGVKELNQVLVVQKTAQSRVKRSHPEKIRAKKIDYFETKYKLETDYNS